LDEYFPLDYVSQFPGFEIISEPGTYFVCSAVTLAATVIAKRETEIPITEQEAEKHDDGTSKSLMYYLNDGTYTSFMPLMLERLLEPDKFMLPRLIPNVDRDLKRGSQLFKSTIWGPTCDGVDWIAKSVLLPELFVGEYVAFGDMGAYNQAMATLFNGMPLPRTVYIANESWNDSDKNSIKKCFKDVQIKSL
jgi:ornithine decarboxylase